MPSHQSFLPLHSPECLLMASSAHNAWLTRLSLTNYELSKSSDGILNPLDLPNIPSIPSPVSGS